MPNIIYVCGYKLMGLDAIIPILMQVRDKFDVNIIILFPNTETYRKIQLNHHLWKALTGAQFKVIRKETLCKSILSLLRIFAEMCFQKNIIIKEKDLLPKHSMLVFMMKLFSKTIEIYLVISNQTKECYRTFLYCHSLVKK